MRDLTHLHQVLRDKVSSAFCLLPTAFCPNPRQAIKNFRHADGVFLRMTH